MHSTLLSHSLALASVKTKKDLLKVINSYLKGRFLPDHPTFFLFNKNRETISDFLFDPASPAKENYFRQELIAPVSVKFIAFQNQKAGHQKRTFKTELIGEQIARNVQIVAVSFSGLRYDAALLNRIYHNILKIKYSCKMA